jgi:ureidoacrylate peracid hydrolase
MSRIKSSPALFIIDMQNGFCHPSGSFSKVGLPVSRQLSIIPAINKLRSLSHEHGIPIFYTRSAFNEDYSDAGLDVHTKPQLKEVKAFVRGTWDAEILEDLKPEPSDTIVTKTRNTAFWGTSLDKLLQQRGIDQIIATGVGTNVCVESTVRDAFAYGFHTLTVSDATATLTEEMQNASMVNLKEFGGIITLEELESELKSWKSSDLPS